MALIVAARDLGDEQISRVCEQILQEEQAMAQDLETNLPVVVRDILQAQHA
jgi:ferritin-like metal-binding protein YciE